MNIVEGANWQRSSHCDSGHCVEVATYLSPDGRRFLVRHSDNPDTHLLFSEEEWHLFVAGVLDGEFL